jgi:hypothetical protein
VTSISVKNGNTATKRNCVQVEEENVHTKNYINEKCVEKNIQRAKI